jgi:NAD-dependent deacetylase
MKKLVVLSGAGVSAESGIPTFRDAGGLWEGYKVKDVATPEAGQKTSPRIIFYNQRRKAALEANTMYVVCVKLTITIKGRLIQAALSNFSRTIVKSFHKICYLIAFLSEERVDAGLDFDKLIFPYLQMCLEPQFQAGVGIEAECRISC